MKNIVHIKISDKGWILEKLASELATRLPYVSYGLEHDSNSEIQYYMTYGCHQERVSPIEVALFTHKEDVPSAADKFDKVASNVDFCVAQSIKTESIIRELGLSNVETISPGVDLNIFSPVVRIGVVGRTYHTGRKGEKLVAQVMDIPGIEWHFTGEGWPGPANFIEESKLPDFYRSLDYILVPALIEGGPMCVLEALASGCKVIASPVGWVPQFPHIEFKLGDASDLRRVLLEVVEEKLALRKSVENYTWKVWADKHHNLFTRLLNRDPLIEKNHNEQRIFTPEILPHQQESKLSVLVAVHGAEMTTSLGGPSVRAPKTVEALRQLGTDANFVSNRNFSTEGVDLVHVLNVWHPDECEVLLRQVEKNQRPSVLSPIFLDLSELNFYNVRVRKILSDSENIEDALHDLSILCNENTNHRSLPLTAREPFPNYFLAIRRLATYSNHLILLSHHEKSLLKQIGVNHPSTSIVKNPVNTVVFESGDPSLFKNAFDVQDYVLCVGRIESRKNQALLALALKDTGIPLVLIGHEADAKYADLIRKWGDENVIFAGRIEANSPMLASAFSGAKVFCLPSWSEGAPLVALEAAAAGCNMVLSDRSSESEYFGELARYVNPADVSDIRQKILDAWNDSELTNSCRSDKLMHKMRTEHSWEAYARQTQDAYKAALSCQAKKPALLESKENKRIFVDLTTLAHHNATPTGIARVESRLAEELEKFYGVNVDFILWNSRYGKFIKVEYADLINARIKDFAGENIPGFPPGIPKSNVHFKSDDLILIFGGAWIRNSNYLRDLQSLKKMHGVAVVSTVYDIIQHKMKYLFPEGVGEQFAVNCKKIISISDMVITCSEQSRSDIVDFCIETQTPLCPVSVFRLGDEPVHADSNNDIEFYREGLSELAVDDKFVMFVSTIDVRKNHSLLLMLWKGLISEYGDDVPKLVLVGNVGWRGEESVNILNNNPALKNKVLMLHGIQDSTLDWLYKHCLFTVFPSRYEGWGLPVAESCRYGKFCLASNAGSLPEVAPGCAEYIDPLDCIAWYKALQKYCFDPALLAQKTKLAMKYQPTNWQQTAQQVINSIKDVCASTRLESLNINGEICFSAKTLPGMFSSDKFTLDGWYQIENTGTWTSGNESYIGFQYDEQPTSELALTITAFGYVPTSEAIIVNVFVNNVMVAKWEVDGKRTNLTAPIDSSILQSSKNIIVRLEIENPRSPSEFGSNDTRMLGLHVISANLINGSPVSDVIQRSLLKAEGGQKNRLIHTLRISKRVENKLRQIKRRLTS